MRIKKVFNNNILLAEDDRMLEMILLGKGIGFGMKPGDIPDTAKVEKTYKIDSEEIMDRFVKLADDIPLNHLELTQQVIAAAEKDLNIRFDDSIFIGLADHISYAIRRFREGNSLNNALLWEIKRFYKAEFQAAKHSLNIIEHDEGIRLSEDEASFIAMHFVNGQQSGDGVRNTAIATEVIQDILSIIQYHYHIRLDEESINYSRFITHIRFFLQRAHTPARSEGDLFLFEQIRSKYPDTYECVLRVSTYLGSKLGIMLSEEEMLYFMLHIHRLTEREKSQN